MIKILLLLFTLNLLTACFDSGGGDDSSGGGLFNNHKLVENTFILIPPSEKTYLEGENIDLVLRHSYQINVTGSPRLVIDIGGNTVYANYLTGSGTSNLTFRYTVVAGDDDSDGIEVDSSIDLNGGQLQFSQAGVLTDANTDFESLSTQDLKVDTTAPTLGLITPPTAKTYYYNQQIAFIGLFDDAVKVTGTPRLQLDIGGSTAYANYSAGSNSTTLIFRYTVQGTDVDLDGITMTSPLDLNGGSIKDGNGNDASLSFFAIPMPTTFVDGDTPYVTSLTKPLDHTYLALEFMDVKVNFTEAINVSGVPRIAATLGADTRYFTYVSGSGTNTLTFRYLIQEGDEDTDGVMFDNTIDLNGGTLRDATSVDADLNLAPPLMPNVLVDAGRAEVTSITKPSDKTYLANEEMFFALNFDRPVSVSGNPRLIMNLTSGTAYASYVSGSDTNRLVFRHQVVLGELDLDGVELGNSIELNSGEIKGSNEINANLDMTTAVSAIDLSAVLIDAAPASITALAVPADNMYVTGNDLDFNITFSRSVNITGTPRLQIDLGGNTVFATYQSGTGTNNLLFRYSVQAVDNDNDGIIFTSNSIGLNGGTINDSNGSSANLDFTSFIPDLTGVTVNVATVVINSITPPADNTYIETNNIDFVANISELVNVTGSPRLQINIGGVTKYADYLSGTGTAALTFRYIVESGLTDSDGIVLSSPLDLNGGTIQNGSLQNLDTSFVAPSMPNVLVDTTAPVVAITTPIDNSYINLANNSSTFAVSGTCNESGQTVNIQVDASNANSQVGFVCDGTNFSGTIDTNGISQGAFVMTAVLQDQGGNEATSTGINLTKDTIAPLVALSTPADNSSINSANDSATFSVTGTCDENLATVIIEIDAVAASSPVGFSCNGTNFTGTIDTTALADATYSFTAKITDAAGNEVTSVAHTVVKDRVDPTVSILSPTDSSYINIANNSTTFAVSGNCNEVGLTVAIEVDGGAATSPVGFSCNGTTYSGTIDVTGLSEGAHTLQAKLTDAALNEGTSALINITKDTVAPTIALISPADSSTITSGNDSTTFAVNGSCDESGLTASIEVDGVAASSQVGFNCDGSNFSGTIDSTSLAEGILSFTAVITDLAGNETTSASHSVTRDVTAPTVAITSPLNASYINASNNSSTFTVSGTCNEASQTVTIEVDGGAAASPVGFSCNGTSFTGTIDTTALSEAAHSLVAKLSDGINEGISGTINITKDSVVPLVNSITPPNPNYYLESDDVNFTLNTSENVVVSGSPRIQLDVGGFTLYATYASGSNSSSLVFTYTVQAGDQDSNGIGFGSSLIALNSGTIFDSAQNPINLNLDAVAALPNLSSVLVDGVLPTVSITDAVDINAANETTYSVSGTCSENGRTVTVSIGGISATPTCSSNAWTSGAIDVSGLADTGALSITADHQATSGNNAVQAQVNVVKNSAVPQVAITFAQDITSANATGYAVSGTCTENGRIVDVFIGSLNFQPNCSGGSWTTGYVDVSSLADNPSLLITADHSDGVTSATQATRTVDKNTTGPVVTISSAPNINIGNETNYIVSGTCSENGQIVDVYIDSINITPTCSSGTWTTGSQDVSSIPDGSGINVTADHQTSGGTPATQAIATINKDSGSPTVADLSVPTTLKDSADLDWNLNDPGGYTINDYEVNYRVKGSSTWLSFSDGVSLNTYTTVTGLLASTTYQFRVRVQYDGATYSSWTTTAEGTTKPDDPLFDSPYKAMNVGGSTDTNVVAYYDNTRVYINGVEIASSPLSAGQVVNLSQAPDSITTSQYDVVDADKPIYVAGRKGSGGNTAKGNIVWQPTAWAGKSFSFNSIRDNPQQLFVYATENSTIEVKQGSTVLASTTISAGSGANLSWSVYGSYQITSTGTILAYHSSGTIGSRLVDPKPLLPSHTELIGFPSNSMRLTADLDGTNYNIIHSNSITASGSLNKADVIQINPQGGPTALFQSESLLISSDKKTSGASFADSNGNKASPFLPTNQLKKRYAINNSADFVAFASKAAGTIDVYSPGQTIGVDPPIQTLTLTNSGGGANAPYKARVGTTPTGYRFISTVPMAGWYQPDNDTGSADQDETILYGTDELP